MSQDRRSEIVQVVQAVDCVYYMTVDYEEGDIGHATGSVFRIETPRPEDQVPERVLAANDTLSTLWLSSQGSLWVGSADGRVASTAGLAWAKGKQEGNVIYDSEGSGLSWVVADLPVVRGSKLPPNITAMWGTDNSNVFVGADGGHIYQWRGQRWEQTYDGPPSGEGTLSAFGGSAPDDVFAVGRDATVLHYNGSTWTRLALPGAANGHETFTGVVPAPDGQVFISAAGDQGRLLHGTALGLTEFGRYQHPLIGMARLGNKIVFATGAGCAELRGRKVEVIKDSFQTVAVFPGRDRVFFLEPNQGYPGYVDFDPTQGDDAWWGVEF
jgi:hypothetical protein